MKRIPIVILVIIAGAAVSFAQSEADFHNESIAVLSYMEGDVRVEGRPASLGQRVPFGAMVQCGADALAEISFGNRNIMRVEENTVVQIEIGRDVHRASLQTGRVASVVEGLAGLGDRRRSRFFFFFSASVAGVRGTAFFAAVEGPNASYICTCNGELDMETVDGQRETVQAARHIARRFVGVAGGGVEIEEAPLLYHSDEDMDSLAAKVGYTIPWDGM